MSLKGQNKYVFEVAKDATKSQVEEAVERAFKVKVKDVNIIKVPGKTRRFGRRQVKSSSWKKAIVTLEAGHKIDLVEGL
jgi:large subunit ribosomal protein L23